MTAIRVSAVIESGNPNSDHGSQASIRKYATPQSAMKPTTLVSPDTWAKRILAPYLPSTRKPHKAAVKRDMEYYNFFLTKKSSMLMRSMKNYISNKKDLPCLLFETSNVLKDLTNSLGVRLYMVDQLKDQLYQFQKNVTYPRCRVNYDLNTSKTVAAYAARSKEFIMVDDVNKDSRFPDGVSYKDNVKAVLCLPIVAQYSTYAVIEMYKDVTQAPYQKHDLKLAVVLCGWIGLTIQENQEGFMLHHKQDINTTLLQMVLKYYSEPHTFDLLLSEILNYAKKEIGAEKGTLYVITNDEKMIADVYEEGISDFHKFLVKKKQSVRFGRENTVACQVFREKQLINVKDLYNDPRFKTQIDIDEELMIIERTELCVPIITNNQLLGIVSIVNKSSDSFFTPEDEQKMQEIATYAGLALYFAKSQRQIVKTKNSLDMACDLLQYHLKPCRVELIKLEEDIKSMDIYPKDLREFSFYIATDDLQWMPQIYIKMLRDIVPDDAIDFEQLYPFVLTARRSYRSNPYHNFEHAFNVSHCMYTILIRNLEKFTLIERQALMIAALTHDIDHSGVTNNFLSLTNHRLSLIYEDSIWENHHCFVTEQLLNKYRIFKNLGEDTVPAFLKQVHENIIFTDLMTYFKNRTVVVPIINQGTFDFNDSAHKYCLRSVVMTMADLSGQGKPFSVTKRLTDALYREFYAQGDTEKEMGFTPLSMMDRNSESHIPDDQSQFLSIVVMSAADIIRTLLPNTQEIYMNAEMLRDTWHRILESRGEKLWRQCESVVP